MQIHKPQTAMTGNLLDDAEDAEVGTDFVHLAMDMLAKAYKDQYRAILNEYAANGRDSHRVAGTPKRPVEVTLPNALSLDLIIRDYGTGLNEQTIRRISNHESFKSMDDIQTGGFGIGSKSAFSYTDQFTIESVHEGHKTVMLMFYAEGKQKRKVLFDGPTDEPNGVTVTIPTKREDVGTWAKKAKMTYSTWPSGSVLVDGEPNVCKFDTMDEVADRIWRGKRGDGYYSVTEPTYIVVDGIAYTLDASIASRIEAPVLVKPNTYIEMPIGSVDILHTREGLRDTPRTLDSLRARMTAVTEGVLGDYEARLAECDTDAARCKVWRDARKVCEKVGLLTPDSPVDLKSKAKVTDVMVYETEKPRYGYGEGKTVRSPFVKFFADSTMDTDALWVIEPGENVNRVYRMVKRWRDEHDQRPVIVVGHNGVPTSNGYWAFDPAVHEYLTGEEFIEQAKDCAPTSSRTTRTYSFLTATGRVEREVTNCVADKPVVISGTYIPRYVQDLLLADYDILVLSERQSNEVAVKRLGDDYAGDVSTKRKEVEARLAVERRDRVASVIGSFSDDDLTIAVLSRYSGHSGCRLLRDALPVGSKARAFMDSIVDRPYRLDDLVSALADVDWVKADGSEYSAEWPHPFMRHFATAQADGETLREAAKVIVAAVG